MVFPFGHQLIAFYNLLILNNHEKLFPNTTAAWSSTNTAFQSARRNVVTIWETSPDQVSPKPCTSRYVVAQPAPAHAFTSHSIAGSGGSANPKLSFIGRWFQCEPGSVTYANTGSLVPDRYAPAGFVADAGRLKISISAADGAQLRPSAFSSTFYNTQGRKFDQRGKCATIAKGDLYIPADWASNFRRSDIWATAFDASDAVSFYPIIGFRNVTGSSPQLSYYDGLGWVELGPPSGHTIPGTPWSSG